MFAIKIPIEKHENKHRYAIVMTYGEIQRVLEGDMFTLSLNKVANRETTLVVMPCQPDGAFSMSITEKLKRLRQMNEAEGNKTHFEALSLPPSRLSSLFQGNKGASIMIEGIPSSDDGSIDLISTPSEETFFTQIAEYGMKVDGDKIERAEDVKGGD